MQFDKSKCILLEHQKPALMSAVMWFNKAFMLSFDAILKVLSSTWYIVLLKELSGASLINSDFVVIVPLQKAVYHGLSWVDMS